MNLDLRAVEDYRGRSYPVGSSGTPGDTTRLTDIFGSAFDRKLSPQVFLVDTQPRHVIGAHYHAVPQFQIAMRGSGRLGRHPIDGVVLHFADAWSSYGPIVAGEDGLSFFTIRMWPDTGAHYMPGERGAKRGRDGRQVTVAIDCDEASETTIRMHHIAPADDGLEVVEIHAAPGDPIALGAPLTKSGRLFVVVRGEIVVASRSYGSWSWGHQATGDSENAVRAGDAGAQVLCMSFPTTTSAQGAS